MKQVVTIGADGSVSGLQRKPGQGLDLRRMGVAKILRISEILHDDARQAWFVRVLDREAIIYMRGVDERGMDLTQAQWNLATGSAGLPAPALTAPGCTVHDVLFFDDYDDAVKVEIAFLDALRLNGVFDRLT